MLGVLSMRPRRMRLSRAARLARGCDLKIESDR
jgi:hypothetical protein